jgi:hypothetical protein
MTSVGAPVEGNSRFPGKESIATREAGQLRRDALLQVPLTPFLPNSGKREWRCIHRFPVRTVAQTVPSASCQRHPAALEFGHFPRGLSPALNPALDLVQVFPANPRTKRATRSTSARPRWARSSDISPVLWLNWIQLFTFITDDSASSRNLRWSASIRRPFGLSVGSSAGLSPTRRTSRSVPSAASRRENQ